MLFGLSFLRYSSLRHNPVDDFGKISETLFRVIFRVGIRSLRNIPDQDEQFVQIDEPQQAASTSDFAERVLWRKTRPTCGNRSKIALLVMKVNTILTPVQAIGHQRESPSSQRMKRMRDDKGSFVTGQITCS